MNGALNAFRLAWRNVLRNRRRSLVTILIATVGCTAVLVATGFALATYDQLRDGELHLLRLMPAAWLKPGAACRFDAVSVVSGPEQIAAAVDAQAGRDAYGNRA